MKAEPYEIEIDREPGQQQEAYVRQVHRRAVIAVSAVTGGYGASQVTLAQECIGALFSLDREGAKMLVAAWSAELHGAKKDLATENEALRRFAAAEDVIRAGRKQ